MWLGFQQGVIRYLRPAKRVSVRGLHRILDACFKASDPPSWIVYLGMIGPKSPVPT